MAQVTYGGRNPFRRTICSEEDIRQNWYNMSELHDLLGNPTTPTTEMVDIEPPRGYVRFTLTSTFSGNPSFATADAYIWDGAAHATDSADNITVYDPMQRFGSAAGTESGIAVVWVDTNGDEFYEVTSLDVPPGSATDNYTVKVDAGSTPAFLESVWDASMAVAFDVPATHQWVYADVSGGKQRLYTAKATGSATDEKVKVDATDTADYLNQMFTNVGTGPGSGAADQQVVYLDQVGGAGNQLTLYTSSTGEGKVQSTSGDPTANYLPDEIYNNNGSPPAQDIGGAHQEVFATIAGSGDIKTVFYTNAIAAASVEEIVYFELLTDKPKTGGGSTTVSAKVIDTDESDGDTITLRDDENNWYGKDGWNGIAGKRRGDSTEWFIIQMEQWAEYVVGTILFWDAITQDGENYYSGSTLDQSAHWGGWGTPRDPGSIVTLSVNPDHPMITGGQAPGAGDFVIARRKTLWDTTDPDTIVYEPIYWLPEIASDLKVGRVVSGNEATGPKGTPTAGTMLVQEYDLASTPGPLSQLGSPRTWYNWAVEDPVVDAPVIGMVDANGKTWMLFHGCVVMS